MFIYLLWVHVGLVFCFLYLFGRGLGFGVWPHGLLGQEI